MVVTNFRKSFNAGRPPSPMFWDKGRRLAAMGITGSNYAPKFLSPSNSKVFAKR